MAKVRTKKEHKKRVAKRNNILQQEKKRYEKAQKEFFMKIIEEEKQKGLFDNPIAQLPTPTSIPSIDVGQPSPLNLPNFGIEGPKI